MNESLKKELLDEFKADKESDDETLVNRIIDRAYDEGKKVTMSIGHPDHRIHDYCPECIGYHCAEVYKDGLKRAMEIARQHDHSGDLCMCDGEIANAIEAEMEDK